MLGITDLLKETWSRITGYRYNYRTRLIPIWSLMLPTSFYFAAVHVTSICTEKIYKRLFASLNKMFDDRVLNYFNSFLAFFFTCSFFALLQRRIKCIDEIENEVVDTPYLNAIASLCAQLTAVVVWYPVETVINRLIIQGTRTIIDNTDHGYGVVPINTRYDGFLDCLRSIEHREGIFGLYKGVGVIAFEVLLNFALLKIAKFAAYRIYDAIWISRNDKSNLEFLTQQEFTRPPQ